MKNWNELTLEDCCIFGSIGFEFVIEGGKITDVLHKRPDCRLQPSRFGAAEAVEQAAPVL